MRKSRFGAAAAAVACLALASVAKADPLVDFSTVTADLTTNKAVYIGIGLAVLAIVIGVKLARRLVMSSGVGK